MTGATALHEVAPAKVNLCLFLGPVRPADGRHELVTVFQPLTLADRVTLEPAPLGTARDELVCPGLDLPAADNLALRALWAFRAATRWEATPVRLTIDKRIPVAAGLAGGSADAAAVLRLAARASGIGDDALLREVARRLGADVPAQVRPAPVLAEGAGDALRRALPEPAEFGVVLLRARQGLSTAAVFAEADRQGLARAHDDLGARLAAVERAAGTAPFGLPSKLLVNDLEPAARALSHEVGAALDLAREVAADVVLLCGSGPTVAALFADPVAARAARTALAGREPAPLLAGPWHRAEVLA